LWLDFKDEMAEDFRRIDDAPSITLQMIDETVKDIETHLNEMNFSY
jgi:hypothetical protein